MAHPKAKRAHTLPPTTPLSQQVGGHAGVRVTEDESLLIKPTQPREIAFYQFVRDIADPSMGVHTLKAWVPKFFGLLNLEGKLADPIDNIDAGTVPAIIPVSELGDTSTSRDLDTTNDVAPSNIPSQSLVLQNLLYGYHKPCVLDVKLGTVLHEEDASEEKRARMIKKATETTTLQTGVRLTGFQVYSNHSPDPIVYGRAYGYGLKAEQLQEGIRNFFPLSLPLDNADSETSPPSNPNTGLPADTLLTLLTSLHGSLIDLRKSLSDAHVRIVGGSVLIVYEGDWERAIAASGRGGGPGSFEEEESEEDDSEADEGDQIEVEIDEQGEINMESIPSSTTETSSSCSSTDPQPRLYTISLIDFAHTRVVPGEGPDRGVLMGMDTLIRLVDHRKQEVAAFIEVEKSNG